MSAEQQYISEANKSWECDCRKPAVLLPLSRRICPYCKRGIPEHVKKAVYLQVLMELREEALKRSGERWERYARKTARKANRRRIMMVILSLLWIIAVLIVQKEFIPGVLEALYEPARHIVVKLLDIVKTMAPVVLYKTGALLYAAYLLVQELIVHVVDFVRQIISYFR